MLVATFPVCCHSCLNHPTLQCALHGITVEEYLEVTAGSDYGDPGSDAYYLICMDDPAASGAAYVSS